MTAELFQALGGVGLFLAGMLLLTNGLRGLAGRALRRVLSRYTQTPFSGAVAGAATTAIIQSSSATTVTTVGFVAAGLMTFPQALGVIFGANVGTTATAWMVTLLGFKLHLGELVLPVVLAGALLQLVRSGRLQMLGTALVGFSLLFIGIDMMQAGLSTLEGTVTPRDFPDDSLWGRIQLVALGFAVTAITQSSSAGLAAALVALGYGAINFQQAAAMVIGMNIGTTVTAVLATFGGSAAARRTGWAHLVFNFVTGFIAFLLLRPLGGFLTGSAIGHDPQIALAVFHTAFNILGVALFLPFTEQFSRLIMAAVRERGPVLTRRLGRSVLRDPAAATDAAVGTVEEIAQAEIDFLYRRLQRAHVLRSDVTELHDISDALVATQGFIEQITPGTDEGPQTQRMASALHLLDHLRRLLFRFRQEERVSGLTGEPWLEELRDTMSALLLEAKQSPDRGAVESELNKFRKFLRIERERFRERTISQASRSRIDQEAVLLRLDALRWLHRVSYHLWRIEVHLNRLKEARTPSSRLREAAVDVLSD